MPLCLTAPFARAAVHPFGGMVTAEFKVRGRWVSPLFLPAWGGGEGEGGFIGRLRGDFPCVPFGGGAEPPPLPDGWAPEGSAADPDGFAHGFGAHHVWQVLEAGERTARLAVDYPPGHPIRRLERTVTLAKDAPRASFEDRVHARAACRLPAGLHPIFRLPEEAGAAALSLPDCRQARTYPGRVDASSVFAPNAAVGSAKEVPLRGGGTADVTRLPLPMDTEELLQLCGVREGRAAVAYPEEGFRAVLRWDAAVLPSLLLWLSNRGRKEAPWNGRNLCLGVEPVASAFDLGAAASLGETPLPARSFLRLTPEAPLVLAHSLSAEEA